MEYKIKYKEINNLSVDELVRRIATEKENLRKLKFAHAISPIENPIKIRYTRKGIARLQTAYTSKTA
jgi:large subunit ribosomal protein L29